MVRYYSDDGVFDAPVQKVWQLIQAHATHAKDIHTNLVSTKDAPQPDGSVKSDWVVKNPDGTQGSHKLHMRMSPPFSQTAEFLDGPLKGTWFTTTYIPEGHRTRAVTVAEWRMGGVTDEATLMRAANDFFDRGYEADSRYLKTLK